MNQQHKFFIVLLFVLILLTIATATVALAAQSHSGTDLDLSWNVTSASGGHAASASYNLEATLGQPIDDLGTSATIHLSAGFWQTENAGSYRVFLPTMLK